MKKLFLLASLIALSAASLFAQNAASLSTYSWWNRSYIPDLPANPGSDSVVHPIIVRGFAEGDTIGPACTVHSVCVNLEHSFQGDIEIRLVCPNDSSVLLKKARNEHANNLYLGYPYGGNDHHDFDMLQSSDSLDNPFGIGLDYCFSRNAQCTLVTGDPADAELAGEPPYLGIIEFMDSAHVTFGPLPSYFHQGGQGAGTKDFITTRPSDMATMTDYYTPYGDFASLEGCPVNGVWNIVVKDSWGVDNGWFFGATIVFAQEQTEEIVPVASQFLPLVSAAGRTITVRNLRNGPLRVFDMMGRMVYSDAHPAESCRVVVPAAGIYLVQADNNVTQRVAVL